MAKVLAAHRAVELTLVGLSVPARASGIAARNTTTAVLH
jgi:hypothetical protein